MEKKRTFAASLAGASLPIFILFNLLITSCSAQDRAGLVAHWKFDEAKGDKLIDASGNNNHGVIHGATWSAGRVKGGLKFDGVDDNVDVPKSASLDSIKKTITIMCWIKSPLTARHSILERFYYAPGVDQRCLELDIAGGKSVCFILSSDGTGISGGGVFSQKVPANEWVHLAVTSDGRKTKAYINGDLDPTTCPAPSGIFTPNTNLHMGGWFCADVKKEKWEFPFKGTMDEMKIYSRALTHEEILQNYKQTSPKGTVTGKVIDINANPVSGAKVSVGLFPAVTDKAGMFKISVPVRTYNITVSRKGYQRETKPQVKVKVGKTTETNILLTADKVVPSVSKIKAKDVAGVTADIFWETDEPCRGIIRYGASRGKYKDSAEESSYKESHQMTLLGLKPDTRYYFTVENADGAENLAKSREYSFTTQKKSRVILWDSGEIHRDKHKGFRPYKNRAKWKQVPHGATDYQFTGSAVLENEFFYIYFHHNARDSIYLYAKVDGKPGIWVNEMYKRGGNGNGTAYVKVIKNTPDEVVVEHACVSTNGCVSTHRVLSGKPWVEFRAIKNIKTQGIHGKTRIDIVPVEGGNDYVIDSLRHPKKYYRPARSLKEAKMVLCLYESVEHPFLWVFTFPSLKRAKPYITCDSGHGRNTDAFSWGFRKTADIPKNWFSKPNWPRRSWGCIASTHAAFGKDLKEPVLLGALTYWHNWNREELGMPIKAGQEYKSKWKPPYPGRWRMTVRITEKKYDQGWEYDGRTKFQAKHFSKDVYDGNFTFKIPIDGVLDYVLMYMYDRTKDTPANILTPMDQYRWMMEQQK